MLCKFLYQEVYVRNTEVYNIEAYGSEYLGIPCGVTMEIFFLISLGLQHEMFPMSPVCISSSSCCPGSFLGISRCRCPENWRIPGKTPGGAR